MSTNSKIKRALVSVYDKTGLPELATGLHSHGIEIVSTGSTAKTILDLGIPVTEVKDLTGFAQCLDGRVKTLHPKVHAGLLADLRNPDHVKQLTELNILPFELVVVNLYPFSQTVASGASTAECIEKIDIGGPAMVRGGAKNHANVAVVVKPQSYKDVLAAIGANGFTDKQKIGLAIEAFRHVAEYDLAVATWLETEFSDSTERFPNWLGQVWRQSEKLRYGENPHQLAALYQSETNQPGLAQAKILHGKEMSYNNYVDADTARRAAYDHQEPAVAIIKHANPCGIAIGENIAQAYNLAHLTDPISAFGGVIAANRAVTLEMAKAISNVFTEVVVAPAFDDDALVLLCKKENIRLLVADDVALEQNFELRPISGGLLIQTPDTFQAIGDEPTNWKLVSGAPAEPTTMRDLVFAWRASRCVKSNGILLAKNGGAVGIGMGQVNRVDSAKLAVDRAGSDRTRGSVAASDAFFPFSDGLQVLIDAGIAAVVQPGGSVRDDEVIATAKKAGLTMYFTGTRHFFH